MSTALDEINKLRAKNGFTASPDAKTPITGPTIPSTNPGGSSSLQQLNALRAKQGFGVAKPEAVAAPVPDTAVPPVINTDKNSQAIIDKSKTEKLSAGDPNAQPANNFQNFLSSIGLPTKQVKNPFTDVIGSTFDDTVKRIGNFVGTLDSNNPENTPLKRATAGAEATVGAINLVLSPITAVFKTAEKVPVLGLPVKAIDWGIGKVGEISSAVTQKAIEHLPISQTTKDQITPVAKEIAALAAQIYVGDVAGEKGLPVLKEKVTQLSDAITKDMVTNNTLPSHVYIDPVKVQSIFKTGTEITPEEADLVTTLVGKSEDARAAWKDAIKNGVSIEIPASTIVKLVDKPYWAKLKETFGFSPTEKVLNTSTAGAATVAPRGYLPAGSPEIANLEPGSTTGPLSPESLHTSPAIVPGLTEGITAPENVVAALNAPADKTIELIKQFSPLEAQAFGRNLVGALNNSLGTRINHEDLTVPNDVQFLDHAASDGRPAQFYNGKIQVFTPNLIKDIKDLSEGKTLYAHPDTPEFSKVYKLKQGESATNLAVRYTRDVLIHEYSHSKTMDFTDQAKSVKLKNTVDEAVASKDQKQIFGAKLDLENHMKNLEQRALQYEKDHKVEIEKTLFGGPQKRIVQQPTAAQKYLKDIHEGPASKQIVRTEKSLLKSKIKVINRATGEGIKIGEQKATESIQNRKANEIDDAKQKQNLEKLKQRILDRARAENAVTETKIRYEDAIQRINDRSASIESKRALLTDYAQGILPFREQGRLLKSIQNVESDTEFTKVLNRIQKSANLVERASLIKDFQTEIKDTKPTLKNKMPSAKFQYDVQKKLNHIRALQSEFESQAKDLRNKENLNHNPNANAYALAQQKIVDLVSDFQTAHPDEALPDDILSEIQALKMVGLKDMTAKELRAALADLKSLKETGRTLKEIERFNKETEIDRAKSKIFDLITGGKELPSRSTAFKQEPKKTIRGGIKEFITTKHYGWEQLLDDLSKFDKGSKPYESFLSRYAQDQTDRSFNLQNDGEQKSIGDVRDIIKDAYSLKTDKDVLGQINSMKTETDLGKLTYNDGVDRDTKLTKGQALQYYMWDQDPTLEGTFDASLHWNESVREKVFSILTPEDKALGDKLLNFYKDYYEGINEVYSKEYGVDLPFNDNYSPVSRDVEKLTPENVLLAQESKAYATAKNGSLKSRVKNNVELKPTDALENVTRHIVKMEHYKAWSDTMYNLRRIFSDKEVRTAILDLHGKADLALMDNFLNDMARDGVSREKVIVALDKIRANTSKYMLGLNPKVGIKQLAGVSDYLMALPVKDFFGGITNYWGAPLEHSKFLQEHSSVLRERFGDGYERDIKLAINKGYDKMLANKKEISEFFFTAIRNADKFTVLQGSWATFSYKYKEITGKSFDKKNFDQSAVDDAIKFAERVTARVQESSRLDTLSELQRGGSVAKLFTMFQSQQAKYLRVMEDSIRNIKYGRGDKATNYKNLAMAWFIVPFIYNSISNALTPEKYRKSEGKVAVETAVFGPLSDLLIVGQMFQSIQGWLDGETFAYSASPVLTFMDNLQKAGKALNKEDFGKFFTYITDVIGQGTGIPTQIVTKPIRNAEKK